MIIATLATTFSYLWLGWLLLFLIIEGIAIHLDSKTNVSGNTGGTLSEMIWRLRKGNRFFFVVFVLFFVVLAVHFFLYSGT